MPKDALLTRIYRDEALSEIARLIGYQGLGFFELWEKVRERGLDAKFGKQRLLNAVYDLTRADKREASPSRYELNGEAREACHQLLGPDPDDPYYLFKKYAPATVIGEAAAKKWQEEFRQHEQAPEMTAAAREEDARQHASKQPPQPEQQGSEAAAPAAEEVAEEAMSGALPGISPAGYARQASECNRRQLLCMLRDARKKLEHHGRRSFMGKEAKKAIAAAEAELRSRGLGIPPAGEETAQWDRKKKPAAAEVQWRQRVAVEKREADAPIEVQAADANPAVFPPAEMTEEAAQEQPKAKSELGRRRAFW